MHQFKALQLHIRSFNVIFLLICTGWGVYLDVEVYPVKHAWHLTL